MVCGSRNTICAPGLGHHDREPAVRGEVQVVRVVHLHRLPERPGDGIDRGERVAGVVVDPQRPQVPGGHDVLRAGADADGADHLVVARVNDGHGAAADVGHVHQRRSRRATGAISPGRSAAYRSWGFSGGGIPGNTPADPGGADEPGGVVDTAAVVPVAAGVPEGTSHEAVKSAANTATVSAVARTETRCHVINSVMVTGASPRPRRPCSNDGIAAMVAGCPQWRLTIEPGRTAASVLDTIADGGGSV